MAINYISKFFSNFGKNSSVTENNIRFNKNFDPILMDEYFFKENSNITAQEYSDNVIVHRCVNIISQAASHVPWVIYKKSNNASLKRLASHPIYGLLQKPNNKQGGADFFSELVATKLLYGDCFILGLGQNNIEKLNLLHPSNIQINSHNGAISDFEYCSQGKTIKFPIDEKKRKCRVLHIKNYNPNSSSNRGVSSLKAASKSIELHNQTTKWNNNLLKNGARPTGALVMRDSGTQLSDEQFERLKEELSVKYMGGNNSGRPLLLEGGLDWKDMSIHPKDMDYIDAKNSAAREIALAFGLPPQLLGITGDNTYSNMQEARLALWEETIIPLLDKIADNLSNWLSIWYDQDIIIDFDRDGISALSEKRKNSLDKISHANFMTLNEKRALINLPPIEGGDKIDNQ